LLVDGDLRRPQVQSLFGIPGRPGVADVVAGRAAIDDAVQYVSEVGLSVIPAGRPGNPRDLLAPDRLAPILEELRGEHDIVVIDSPPLDPMVDTRSWSAVADGVLMVIRARQSKHPAVERALRALSSATIIGAVLTGADVPTERAYARYGRGTRR
jgi:Mrp family chromosome partitioning ATPase